MGSSFERSAACLCSRKWYYGGAAKIGLALLGLSLPDCGGVDILTTAHTRLPHVPIIVVTGLAEEAQAAGAFREGAQGYWEDGICDNAYLCLTDN